jgi:hypothetical protein
LRLAQPRERDIGRSYRGTQRRRHDAWRRVSGDFELEPGQPAPIPFREQRGNGGGGAFHDAHQPEAAGVIAESLGEAGGGASDRYVASNA